MNLSKIRFEFFSSLHSFILINVFWSQNVAFGLFVNYTDFQRNFFRWTLRYFKIVVFLQLLIQIFYWRYFLSPVQNWYDCWFYFRFHFFAWWGYACLWAFRVIRLILRVIFRGLFIKYKFFFDVFIIIIKINFEKLWFFDLFLDSRFSNTLNFSF